MAALESPQADHQRTLGCTQMGRGSEAREFRSQPGHSSRRTVAQNRIAASQSGTGRVIVIGSQADDGEEA